MGKMNKLKPIDDYEGHYVDAGKVQDGEEYIYFVYLHAACVAISLLANAAISTVLYRQRKKLFESTFYIVVAWLILFTTLGTAVQAISTAPQYFLKRDPFTATYRDFIYTLDTFAHYGMLSFSTLMAANRLAAFQLGCKSKFFTRPRFNYVVGATFLLTAILTAAQTAIGCVRKYSTETNSYYDTCPSTGISPFVEGVLTYIYYFISLISAFFHVRTYWLIRHQRGKLMSDEPAFFGPEFIILKQALIIFTLYLCSMVLWTIIPTMENESAQVFFYLSYSLNINMLFITIAFPAFFLVTSTEFRREIASLLFPTCKTFRRTTSRTSPYTS